MASKQTVESIRRAVSGMLSESVLVVNVGSSSLKLRLLDERGTVVQGWDLPARHGRFDREALDDVLAQVDEVGAVGHRIVHGGTHYTGAVLVDAEVQRVLRSLCDLAPLHQPRSLAALEAVTAVLPDVPAVACFDTAFHATLPRASATYPLPREWRERYGLRRYGFHGLSHAYATRRAAELLDRPAEQLRVVSCHLGAGASLTAIERGRSVDTTMGFTPLDGLVMATRSGSVDPGLLIWLQEHVGMSVEELSVALEERSGLVGLAGEADVRQLTERATSGDDLARLGLDVYVHRLRSGIAAMAAAIGGLDTLVFTGGVGENSAYVRAAAAGGLAFLGIALDQTRNQDTAGDRNISDAGADVQTLVVIAREDLEIATQTRAVLAARRRRRG